MNPAVINHVIDAKTADFTTEALQLLRGAKKATLFVKAASISSGNGVFKVQGSYAADGTYVDMNILIDNVTNTNAQTLTRVASVTLSSNTTKAYALDLEHFTLPFMKVDLNMTTDGTYDAWLVVEE